MTKTPAETPEDIAPRFSFPSAGPPPGGGRSSGRPWAGIAEEAPAISIGWLRAAAHALGRDLDSLHLAARGVRIEVVCVPFALGVRWLFVCPSCGRHVQAIYLLESPACRECHRLGYRSQTHRPTSLWGALDGLFDGRRGLPRRYQAPPDASIMSVLEEMLRARADKLIEAILDNIALEEA